VGGTPRAFTEALLKASAQTTFNAVAKVPRMIVMSANHKQLFSAFTGIAVNRFQIDKKKGQGAIVGGADVYMSDFGEMEIVPHYLMSGGTVVYGLNVEHGDAVYLRGFQSTPLGKTGDNVKEQVLVDATFRLTGEAACFKIADLTA
jgi:translation elongation factor EF-G